MNGIYQLPHQWRYQLDRHNVGLKEGWYAKQLPLDCINFPGTTASNQIGDKLSITPNLTKESIKCLREGYSYQGVVWYQTTLQVDYEKDEDVILFLERVMFESTIFIDGIEVGKCDSLSTPHQYQLTEYLTPSKEHVITIRINNDDVRNIGPYASAYTIDTQTIWNGIVGRMELQVVPILRIKNLQTEVCLKEDLLNICFDVNCTRDISKEVTVQVQIKDEERVVSIRDKVVVISKGNIGVSVSKMIQQEIELWDEFNPKLYQVVIIILDSNEDVLATTAYTTGFRSIDNKDCHINMNGIPRFLRGNTDCCIYPLTGYPPMDIAKWEEVLGATKEAGFNHVRFHSFCPPQAAFEVADKLGMYFQIEGPVWMDNWMNFTVGCRKEHYEYLPAEAKRIIREYGHHPSFCIFSNGNELNGDFTLLEDIIKSTRDINKNILYTSTTNWERQINTQDDLYIAQSIDGNGIRGQFYLDSLVKGAKLDFSEVLTHMPIPVISHEVGQYVVYPNVNEITKFKGVLQPLNYIAIQNDLIEKGLLPYLSKFVKASGRLSYSLYKAEMEAALRTKKLAGVQLLGLQDFPGQSTATIGLYDCFFDCKEFTTPREIRSFCNSTVVIANYDKNTYSTKEDISIEFLTAHYGNLPIENALIEIRVTNYNEELLFTQTVPMEVVPIGLTRVARITLPFTNKLTGRSEIIIQSCIKDISEWNKWNIWVYEPGVDRVVFDNCYTSWNNEIIDKLENGEKVIIFPPSSSVREVCPSTYFPVFWSPVHFTSKDPCGMIIENTHPLFSHYFTCKSYADIEWKNILEHSIGINIDELKELVPLTMYVPNFYNNHKVTNLFEANVLNGKVIVCSINFENTSIQYPEMMYLEYALYRYYESKEFIPMETIKLEKLSSLFQQTEVKINHRKNVALKKPAYANSELSSCYAACNGNDDNATTYWSAGDTASGYQWMVDLEMEYQVTGIRITFTQEANYLFVIHTSSDKVIWDLQSNQTGQITTEVVREINFNTAARYVRITYNMVPSGVKASHKEFEVFISE